MRRTIQRARFSMPGHFRERIWNPPWIRASNANLSISVRALENGVVEIAIAQEVLPCAGTVQLNIGPYFGSGALTMVGGGESQQIVATGDTGITFQAKAGGVSIAGFS
ncbi:MAG: hypothetical protein ACLR23_23585 [Clostridia bacterium]